MTVARTIHRDRETRDRLLKAAERLFAERGFKDVTVREICDEAHANVAAVNYHFGDKLGLYREVLQGAIGAMRSATEAARQAGGGQPADEKLRRYIVLFLRRLLATDHDTIHKLIDREMGNPTPALDDLVEQGIRPRIEYLSGVIAEILDCDPAERIVLLCVMSVQSQLLMYARRNPLAERIGFCPKSSRTAIDEAARHIAAFSLGGIRGIRPVRARGAAVQVSSRRVSRR